MPDPFPAGPSVNDPGPSSASTPKAQPTGVFQALSQAQHAQADDLSLRKKLSRAAGEPGRTGKQSLDEKQRHRSESIDRDDGYNPRQDDHRTWAPSENLTGLGRFLARVHRSHVFVRYFTYITPVVLVLLVPLLIGTFAAKKASVGGVSLMWFSIWLMIVWLTLWAARLVSTALPVFLAVITLAGSKNPVKWRGMGSQLELPLTLFLWWLAIEVSFLPTMTSHHLNGDHSTRDWERTTNKVLLSVMIGTLLNFVEKILIQLAAMSFHLRTYQDRIEFNKDQIDVLTRLYSHAKDSFADDHSEDELPDYGVTLFGSRPLSRISLFGGDKSRPASVDGLDEKKSGDEHGYVPVTKSAPVSGQHSPTNDPRLSSFVSRKLVPNRAIGRIGGAFRRAAHDFSGGEGSVRTDGLKVLSRLETTNGACALARQLFKAYADHDDQVVRKEAFEPVFEDEDEVEAAFLIFDKDLNGDISLEELQAVAAEISTERLAIADSLKNMDSVISKLDSVLVFIVVVITIIVFISLISTNAGTALASAGSSVLALSWLFSATAQEFLQSNIFVFVKHPFDVGDRVTIYGNTGAEMKGDDYYVKKISLLYTEFRKLAGQVVQAPNSYLNTLFILNQRRSGSLAEAVELRIKFGTTLEQIECLAAELTSFVEAEKREFKPKILTELREVSEVHMLKLNVVFFYKSNWQDELLRLRRRNKFICALMVAMQHAEIEGPRMRFPGQKQSFPVYIQHALHEGKHPHAGSWGTPDQPAGLETVDEDDEEKENGEQNKSGDGKPGRKAGPFIVTEPAPGSTFRPTVGDGEPESATSTGADLRRFRTGQSDITRRRGYSGASSLHVPDYSLGMQSMTSEDYYDLQNDGTEERQRKIMDAFRKKGPGGSTMSGLNSADRSRRGQLGRKESRTGGSGAGSVESASATAFPAFPSGLGRANTDSRQAGSLFRRLRSIKRSNNAGTEDLERLGGSRPVSGPASRAGSAGGGERGPGGLGLGTGQPGGMTPIVEARSPGVSTINLASLELPAGEDVDGHGEHGDGVWMGRPNSKVRRSQTDIR